MAMSENIPKEHIKELGPVGSAILEESTGGWHPMYRIKKGDRYTEWGLYESLWTLDDQVYVSPYYASDWLETDAVTAIGIIAKGEVTGEH